MDSTQSAPDAADTEQYDADRGKTYAEHAALRADGGPEHGDLCDLCREVPAEHELTVTFESGPSIRLDACLGCRVHVEDSGRVVEPSEEIDSLGLLDIDPAGIRLDLDLDGRLTPRQAARLGSQLSVAAHLDLAEWTEVDR